jgi:hypothetical protein
MLNQSCRVLAINSSKQTWTTGIGCLWQWWREWLPLCRSSKHWLPSSLVSASPPPPRSTAPKSTCSHTSNVSSSSVPRPHRHSYSSQPGMSHSVPTSGSKSVSYLYCRTNHAVFKQLLLRNVSKGCAIATLDMALLVLSLYSVNGRMINEYTAAGGTQIGRGNRSTRRNIASVTMSTINPILPHQDVNSLGVICTSRNVMYCFV